MRNHSKTAAWICLCSVVFAICSSFVSAMAFAAVETPRAENGAESRTWIVKWKSLPDPAFGQLSETIRAYPSSNTVVARPAPGLSAKDWTAKWERSPYVKYIVPNRSAEIAALANDPFLDRQKYLQQTKVTEAWSVANQNETIVIAVVDTGVDLDHPDLKDNLVPGINLVQPNLPPRDDNGHGTNVAGVIAASGNNSIGISGVLWKAKIMPVKALEPSGRGDEDKLGEGIRYAIDHGAKIVVLSVGLFRDDPYLREIVQYAEDRDVLLVAAAGNDEGRNVRYPAAYPTVLAVGGVSDEGGIEERANYGPELDLVAPWSVFTTANGGKYEYQDGTSMAAPQVAAAAALVWAKYPDMKVHEVRNLLRQTAEDIGEPGWDIRTGYGLLRTDRALNASYTPDFYEPNDRLQEAKPYPLGRMISAELKGGNDSDWFAVDVPYDGVMKLELAADSVPPAAVQMVHYARAGARPAVYAYASGQPLALKVTKGRNWVVLKFADPKTTAAWPYRLSSSFAVARDPFEANDRQYQAFKLPPRSQVVTGTFHQERDKDWFSMTIERSGVLNLKVSVDTKRINPVLTVQKKGERAVAVNDNGDGEPEYFSVEALPGTYYFEISKTTPDPVAGEYAFEIEYVPKVIDPNEPNDRSYQATVISFDYAYEGAFDRVDDIDWYKFTIDDRNLVRLSLTDIPADREMSAALHNSGLGLIVRQTNDKGARELHMEQPLNAGTYYLRLSSNGPFQEQMYRFRVHAAKLVGGYTDIDGHWAQEAIVGLTDRRIAEGYGAYAFMPERGITRAEAAAMLVRAFGYTKRQEIGFTDLPETHWAYDSIAKAAQAGLVVGYPDGRFGPDDPLTRIEMAVMIANALGLGGKLRGAVPFADLDDDYWALPILKQLKAEGWVTGYDDGTFRPDAPTTRAEFASLLFKVLHR